jgi:antitoxin MazE
VEHNTMQTQLAKWGHSLAVRIPKAAAEKAGLKAGDRLDLELDAQGALTLRPRTPSYTLEELVSGITPENHHDDLDWGKPMGEEMW